VGNRQIVAVIVTIMLLVCLTTLLVASRRLISSVRESRVESLIDFGSNAKVQFSALVVDENGSPIPHVTGKIFLRASYGKFPEVRNGDTEFDICFNEDGKLTVKLEGHNFSIMKLERPNHRWLKDLDGSSGDSIIRAYNTSYTLSMSEPVYIPQATSPAIFVMVRDGVTDVKVMPSTTVAHRIFVSRSGIALRWPGVRVAR